MFNRLRGKNKDKPGQKVEEQSGSKNSNTLPSKKGRGMKRKVTKQSSKGTLGPGVELQTEPYANSPPLPTRSPPNQAPPSIPETKSSSSSDSPKSPTTRITTHVVRYIG